MKVFPGFLCLLLTLRLCGSVPLSGAMPETSTDAGSTSTGSPVTGPLLGDDDPLPDGQTLREWRQRMKDLDPKSPQASRQVPGLLAIVENRQVPWFTRRQAALMLGRMGANAREAVPRLIQLVARPEPATESAEPPQVWGTKALALFGPMAKDAVPTLVGQLRDGDQPLIVRQVSIEALSQVGGAAPAAVAALIAILEGHTDLPAASVGHDSLRELAAEALGILGAGASPAVLALIRAAESGNDDLRRIAADSLGKLGPAAEQALPTLVDLLVLDSSAGVRDAAMLALPKLGPRGTGVLIHLLDDRDAELRNRAAIALGTAVPAARQALPALRTALQDDDLQVRLSAAEALWKITQNAEPLLSTLLEGLRSEERQQRMQALRLLTTAGDQAKSAIPELERWQQDPRIEVRRIAETALKKLRRVNTEVTEP